MKNATAQVAINANKETIARKIEKAARIFVRAQFAARAAKIGKEFQCTSNKKMVKVQIRNPIQVLAALIEQYGNPVAKGRTQTFTVPKKGTIALTVNAEIAVLTLVNAQ